MLSIGLIVTSFIAGIVTVLTPCVFPFLPVIVGGSSGSNSRFKAFVITASLAFSIVLFTLALKFSTTFIDIPQSFWSILSGSILVFLGYITIFPQVWDSISVRTGLSTKSNEALNRSRSQDSGYWSDVLTGMSLGPVFSSCSPTYFVILSTVLPASFGTGLVYLSAYAIGLAAIMLLIGIIGQSLVSRLQWATSAHGWFKRSLGAIFVLIGLLVITGADKKISESLLDLPVYERYTQLEQDIADKSFFEENDDSQKKTVDSTDSDSPVDLSVSDPYKMPELEGLENWVNSDELTSADLEGKVILVKFWTYSCINCIRTLPTVNMWYEEYADDGLVILGIHAPEFAFEKEIENVRDAANRYEIEYPVVQDNDFTTWRNFENRYWPAAYFVDRDGYVRHTHFGEGDYEHSEEVIRYLLSEGDDSDIPEELVSTDFDATIDGQTSETYLGYGRHENYVGSEQFDAVYEFLSYTDDLESDQWVLEGSWQIDKESIAASSEDSVLRIKYSSNNVYIVAESESGISTIQVSVSGEKIGSVEIDQERLYTLVESDIYMAGEELVLQVGQGVRLYAFTFGK